MTVPELREIIDVCERMLDRQNRLIASLKKEARDTSDAIWLRTQIMDLLGTTHAHVSDKGLRDGVALEVFREQLLRRRTAQLTAVA